MSVSPTITAIIPVYKAEPYLAQCLESLLAQTHQAWEAICVDDGSPDASGAILDAYAAKDARIRVIHQSNAGVSAARNAALAQCRTEYVTMIDADDWVEAEMFEHMLQLATETQADLVQVSLMHNANDGTPLHPIVQRLRAIGRVHCEKLSLCSLSRLNFCAVIKLFRHSIIKKHSLCYPAGQTCGEDSLFLYQYLMFCERIVTSPRQLYHVRASTTSVTKRLNAGQLNIATYLANYLTPLEAYRVLQEKNLPPGRADILCSYYLYKLQTERAVALRFVKNKEEDEEQEIRRASAKAIATLKAQVGFRHLLRTELYSFIENRRREGISLIKTFLSCLTH